MLTPRHRRATRPDQSLFAVLATIAVAAIGCGSDAPSGPGDAIITPGNLGDIVAAAADTTGYASAAASSGFNPFGALPAHATATTAARAITADPFDICESGGVDVSGDFSRIEYQACGFGTCEIDGVVKIELTNGNNRLAATYRRLSVSCDDLPPVVLDGDRLVCTNLQNIEKLRCSYELGSFTGTITGSRLTPRKIGIDGDLFSGFDVSGTVVHDDHGLFWFESLELIGFDDCAWGVPYGGEILVSGAGPTEGTIVFLGCDQFESCFWVDELSVPACETHSWSELVPGDV